MRTCGWYLRQQRHALDTTARSVRSPQALPGARDLCRWFVRNDARRHSRSGFRNVKVEGSIAHPRNSAERGSSPGNLARLWGRVHRRHSLPRPRIQGPNRCCPPLPTASEGRWDERRCWCPAWSGTACRPPIPLLVELAAPFARFDGTQHRGCPTFQNCNVCRSSA